MAKKIKTKDAKKTLEFDIETYTKGFVSESTTDDGNIVKEFFQFKEIQQIIHHPGKGVEIVNYNADRRVFYNDEKGKSQELFEAIDKTMTDWMNSDLKLL